MLKPSKTIRGILAEKLTPKKVKPVVDVTLSQEEAWYHGTMKEDCLPIKAGEEVIFRRAPEHPLTGNKENWIVVGRASKYAYNVSSQLGGPSMRKLIAVTRNAQGEAIHSKMPKYRSSHRKCDKHYTYVLEVMAQRRNTARQLRKK